MKKLIKDYVYGALFSVFMIPMIFIGIKLYDEVLEPKLDKMLHKES